MMRYRSTRGHGPVTLSSALAAGLAPDGGLYVPESLPRFALTDFDGATSLPDVARRLLAPFFAGDALTASLDAIVDEALDFEVQLRPLGDAASSVLELFHGPTAAFKDFGARFLAASLARMHDAYDAQRPTTVLVATSGDTGSAVASAFHRRAGFRVVILYPDGRVSPRQAHQLGAFGDNVQALAVHGSFDDCQALVKRALVDTELATRVPLTSANSISLGRLLPQTSYYAWAALRHWRQHGEPLGFVVPTGNLGNALAALLVASLGLPVREVLLATNANRVLADFFAGGEFEARPSVSTLANAMDVGNPSNFERLRWLQPDTTALRALTSAVAVDDAQLRAATLDAHSELGAVLCPHTAAAWHVLQSLRAGGDERSWAVVATAHPAKFDTVVEPLLGRSVEVPPALASLLARPAHAQPMHADYAALVQVLTG